MTFTDMLPGLVEGRIYSQRITKSDGNTYLQDARYYLDGAGLIYARHEVTRLDSWYEKFTWNPNRHELIADVWEEV